MDIEDIEDEAMVSARFTPGTPWLSRIGNSTSYRTHQHHNDAIVHQTNSLLTRDRSRNERFPFTINPLLLTTPLRTDLPPVTITGGEEFDPAAVFNNIEPVSMAWGADTAELVNPWIVNDNRTTRYNNYNTNLENSSFLGNNSFLDFLKNNLEIKLSLTKTDTRIEIQVSLLTSSGDEISSDTDFIELITNDN